VDYYLLSIRLDLPVLEVPADEPMPVVPVAAPAVETVSDVPVDVLELEEDEVTRILFSTFFTPDTDSAISSARLLAVLSSTLPISVTSPFWTVTSMSDASTNQSSLKRSLISSLIRSSER